MASAGAPMAPIDPLGAVEDRRSRFRCSAAVANEPPFCWLLPAEGMKGGDIERGEEIRE